jgi:uncharacterized protein YlxW (UPF0749 family)
VDPSLLVAVVSVATAIVTTSGGVAVAILTNRREAENAADDSRELTLRERLTLRDEQIADLKARVARLEAENARLKEAQDDA